MTILKKVLGLTAAAVAAASLVGVSSAGAVAYTDTVETPTNYFVPTDAQKFDSPYYRGASEDWGYSHNAIAGTITSATLNLSAFDVDYVAPGYIGERDAVYAYDDGVQTFLGYLTGADNAWEFGNAFVLGASFFNDIATGLQVWVDIDTTNEGWFLTLGKSSLSVDGGRLPPPTPGGVPELGSWALMMLGMAALGATLRQRKSATTFA
jgi:hypothetical protein